MIKWKHYRQKLPTNLLKVRNLPGTIFRKKNKGFYKTVTKNKISGTITPRNIDLIKDVYKVNSLKVKKSKKQIKNNDKENYATNRPEYGKILIIIK